MTLVEQIADDLEYQGAEVELTVWRGGYDHKLFLVWDGKRYNLEDRHSGIETV